MMRGCLIFAGVVLLVVTVAAILAPQATQKTPPNQAVDDQTRAAVMTETAHALIRRVLKDPDSAIFNYDLPRRNGLFCGTVKARNSFGGYGDEIYYILFPFELINSENDSSRVSRLWKLFCFDPDGKPSPVIANNPIDDDLKRAGPSDRAWMLGEMVGGNCGGRNAFRMGEGTSGISKGNAYWNVRCARKNSYEVEVQPSGQARVLECAVIAKLPMAQCYHQMK